MNQPSSSRFPTNDCYIYERYKTFLLNNVSFTALVSLQVNFIRVAHHDSKNEIEKQYLLQHSLTEKVSIATFYNRTCSIATFYYEVNVIGNIICSPPETINLSVHISYISGVFSQAQKIWVYVKIITPS